MLHCLEAKCKRRRVCISIGVISVMGTAVTVFIQFHLRWQGLFSSAGKSTLTAYVMVNTVEPVETKIHIIDPFKTLNGTAEPDGAVPYSVDRFKDGKSTMFSLRDFKFSSVVEDDGLQEHLILTYNETIALSESESSVCQVFCRFPAKSFGWTHFPHFLQQAYPCWSVFQRFRKSAKHYYMILPENRDNLGEYIQSYLDAVKRSNLRVSVLSKNESLSMVRDNCRNDTKSILAERTFSDTGWNRPVRWFMDAKGDVEQLQMAVLGSDFRAGPSDMSLLINVLILDRKGSTRDWAFANDTAQFIHSELGNRVNLTHLLSFSGLSLKGQARAVHSADIIVSPHGAQLSNLAYIRPCTVVVELFPRGYYLQYFQSLVVGARGVSYEGYPTGGDRYNDTLPTLASKTVRVARRRHAIQASPRSLLDSLGELLNASILCRSQLN